MESIGSEGDPAQFYLDSSVIRGSEPEYHFNLMQLFLSHGKIQLRRIAKHLFTDSYYCLLYIV